MNKVVEILMNRDNMTRKEAEKRVEEVRGMLHEAIEYNGGDYDDVEEIMYCELGLEMDYVMDLI